MRCRNQQGSNSVSKFMIGHTSASFPLQLSFHFKPTPPVASTRLTRSKEERTEERREDGTSKPSTHGSKQREFKKRSPGERGDQDSRSVAGGCVEEERGWT